MSIETRKYCQETGRQTILDIALDVHAAVTGSGDMHPNYEQDIDMILIALNSWHRAPGYSERFDSAVKEVLYAVLEEVKVKNLETT